MEANCDYEPHAKVTTIDETTLHPPPSHLLKLLALMATERYRQLWRNHRRGVTRMIVLMTGERRYALTCSKDALREDPLSSGVEWTCGICSS